jgi:hypothetical protein
VKLCTQVLPGRGGKNLTIIVDYCSGKRIYLIQVIREFLENTDIKNILQFYVFFIFLSISEPFDNQEQKKVK